MRPGKMAREVLRNSYKKPATNLYPAEVLEMPVNFRGKLNFIQPKCIGCKLCMKDCPSGAIVINKVADKKFQAVIDFSKCLFCAQCVEVCPKKALETTCDVELAQLDIKNLKVTFGDDKPVTPPSPPAQSAPPVA
jgi:formate hydrogenlyase subunit 6/NADH:ubiquinone oxidoreductase subunit I